MISSWFQVLVVAFFATYQTGKYSALAQVKALCRPGTTQLSEQIMTMMTNYDIYAKAYITDSNLCLKQAVVWWPLQDSF